MSSQTDRDILIEMRADTKHVRESVDRLTASDVKQWEKLDDLAVQVAEQKATTNFLTWAVRLVVGGIVTAVLGAISFFHTKQ